MNTNTSRPLNKFANALRGFAVVAAALATTQANASYIQNCYSGHSNDCGLTGCEGPCTDTLNPRAQCQIGFWVCPSNAGSAVTLTLTPGSCALASRICGCPTSGGPSTTVTGAAIC